MSYDINTMLRKIAEAIIAVLAIFFIVIIVYLFTTHAISLYPDNDKLCREKYGEDYKYLPNSSAQFCVSKDGDIKSL